MINRRQFIGHTTKAGIGAAIALHLPFSAEAHGPSYTFQQDPLAYAYDGLEPFIDATTMQIHYLKHHAAYIKNVNEAIELEHVHASSEFVIFAGISKLSDKVRNNGGGAWNHNFFWKCMAPAGQAVPEKVQQAINASFGSMERFKEAFSTAAMSRFGSGWAWLVHDGNGLKIGSTPNQDNPLRDVGGFWGKPILALDVWEHAYYLKYQNKRKEYIDNWWNVVNWNFVAERLP